MLMKQKREKKVLIRSLPFIFLIERWRQLRYCKEEEKVCKSDSTAFAQGKYLGMWIMKDHFRNYWEMAFEEDQKE